MRETESTVERVRGASWLAWLVRQKEMVFLLVLALAGIGLILLNTRWGAYLSDDSYYYIYPSRDFIAGRGFHPSYIFAPMLPFVLAVISIAGVDGLVAVRWLNAILFGVNLALVVLIIWQMTPTRIFGWVGAGLVLLSDVLVEAHGWAMSEALSFTFLLASVYSLLIFLKTKRWRLWWLSAICSACAILTRYAAVPLAPTIALTLLIFFPSEKVLERIKNAVLYGVVSLLPILAYWVRNQLVSGHPVRYQKLLFEPLDRSMLDWFFYSWFSLFVPGRLLRGREILVGMAIFLVWLAAVVGIAWWLRGRWNTGNRKAFRAGIFLCIAFLVFNVMMLYLARGFTELDVRNTRYLEAMLLVFLIMMAALAGQFWPAAGRGLRLGMLCVFAAFLLYYGYRTFDFSRQVTRLGLGYANAGWHESETVRYIRQHPELVDMVSTGEMGIYFWTGRMPTVLAYFNTQKALVNFLCTKKAPLFLMDQMPADYYGMSHDDAVKNLTLVQRFNDSEMYRCSQP